MVSWEFVAYVNSHLRHISPMLLRTAGYTGSNGLELAFCLGLVVGEMFL